MWLGVGKSVTAHTSGSWLAIAYLLVHLGMALLSQRAPAGLRKVLLVDILLIGWFAGIIGSSGRGDHEEWLASRFLSLWSPVIFFWWGYKWAGETLHFFYDRDFSWGSVNHPAGGAPPWPAQPGVGQEGLKSLN